MAEGGNMANLFSLKGFCPVRAHITSTYIPLAEAGSLSHTSLGNNEMISTICPEKSGMRMAVNSPNYNHNPVAAPFPYCTAICLLMPASLKMPTCSYLRLNSLG